MNNELIFLEPVLKSTLWGGNRLKKDFGLGNEGDGEAWLISAHKNGDCVVSTGKYKRMPLSRLWDEHPELFGDHDGEFPLLIKLIDPGDNLSVQVHPDDKYACDHEGTTSGKTECWYVLDCPEDAEIILGHNAENIDEFTTMFENEDWDALLHRVPVKKGDFFQLEPGTIHALGKGVLVLETQQNSDITYRLYDYGRLRELHTEKALDVTVCPFEENRQEKSVSYGENYSMERLVSCKYYTVSKLTVTGQAELEWPNFTAVSVVDGEGIADGTNIQKGSGFIVPFGHGRLHLCGNMTLIVSQLPRLYLGVDLGGTNIAVGLVTEDEKLLSKASAPTLAERPIEEIAKDMVRLCRSVAGSSFSNVKAVGVGCPGTIDSENGIVVYSNNIKMENVPLASMLSTLLGLPVALENDANAAALGEYSAQKSDSLVLITLGTGIGGGAVLGGELYRGFNGAGFEPGHMPISWEGPVCTCGNTGCWECYASATALVRQTAQAMDADSGSAMHQWVQTNGLNGQTAFRCADLGDSGAKTVVENYIGYLGQGLVSVVNLLQPETIAIGGGISGEGEALLEPLRKYVYARDFNKTNKKVELRTSKLLNDAGIVGAAMSAKTHSVN